MSILLNTFALLMGALVSIYLPMITQTAKILKSAPLANVPFFCVALFASIGIAVLTGSREKEFSCIISLPVWLLSATNPRVGSGHFFVDLFLYLFVIGLIARRILYQTPRL